MTDDEPLIEGHNTHVFSTRYLGKTVEVYCGPTDETKVILGERYVRHCVEEGLPLPRHGNWNHQFPPSYGRRRVFRRLWDNAVVPSPMCGDEIEVEDDRDIPW